MALSSYHLNLEDLRAAVAATNVNEAKGTFDGARNSYTIGANDQLLSAADYRPLIVAYRNGRPVSLSDIATVIDDAENVRLAAWKDNLPAVIVNIQRQPGANIIDVVDRVKRLLPQLRASMPSAVDVAILTDRTTTIRASVADVQYELMLTIALVVMVIFLFLRTLAATIIPSVAVPLSLVGTFGAMYLLGFSLNNLTLMALTISSGFVVDDAIVVIENISRYIEEGDSPLEAALKGSEQIGFTIISLTISLIAVLIPLLFMGDVVGRLFREFAITLAITILISAVVSLTLVPMACAKLLKPITDVRENAFQRHTRIWFDRLIDGYAYLLRAVLDRQTATLLVALATLVLTAWLYVVIPKGFFPVQDTGLIQGISEAPQSISFGAMAERQQALADAILKDPDVESLSSFIGVDGTNITLNSGRLLINLKPHETRTADVSEIIRRLTRETAAVEGISLFMQPVQDLTIDDQVSRTQYQFILEDANAKELAEWAPHLVEKLNSMPHFADVSSDIQANGVSAFIEIDRDTAGRFGITPATIDNALYDAFGQRQVSTIYTNSNQKRVILEANPDQQSSLQSLTSIYVPTSTGTGQVPLSVVARVREETAPLRIDHLGQFPATSISFNLAPGASLGEAVDDITRATQELGLPRSAVIKLQGAALAFQRSLSNELLLILAAIVTVYIVLGVLYESFIHPVTILSTLPSAGIGALLALIAARQDLTVIAIIGIILLIGIVKKNAIMMIDFALDAERNEN